MGMRESWTKASGGGSYIFLYALHSKENLNSKLLFSQVTLPLFSVHLQKSFMELKNFYTHTQTHTFKNKMKKFRFDVILSKTLYILIKVSYLENMPNRKCHYEIKQN